MPWKVCYWVIDENTPIQHSSTKEVPTKINKTRKSTFSNFGDKTEEKHSKSASKAAKTWLPHKEKGGCHTAAAFTILNLHHSEPLKKITAILENTSMEALVDT